MLTPTFLLLSLLAQVFAHVTPYVRTNSQKVGDTKISWSTKCKALAGESATPFKCANFSVPLDYTKPKSTKTLDLTLVRVDATRKPVKGSVLFNPGGPGTSGLNFVLENAQELMTILGGHFNLIGFDPRGINNTLPFQCYKDQYKVTSFGSSNASDVTLGQQFAQAEIQALQCQAATKDIGGLVGTAFVARDMAQIVDALGEDGMLRYWGFSYGTVLGSTFSAMFPEKVDKVVLDGVANVHEYYAGLYNSDFLSLDDVVAGFYSGCFASRDCVLAKQAQNPDDLAQKVDALLENLKYNPIPLYTKASPALITYDTVKTAMWGAMSQPKTWPSWADGLNLLLAGNLTGFYEVLSAFSKPPDQSLEALYGIECGEQSLKVENLTDLAPEIAALAASSVWGGFDFGLSNAIQCVRWKQKAKEIYSGDWTIQTKNPIMFIGNTYDPVTPMVSAKNVSASFQSSVFLQHNGYGHTSLAQPGLCSARAVSAYFNEGVLPASDTICQHDDPLFSGETWQQALAPLSHNGTKASITKKDNEDALLLAALGKVGQSVHSHRK
ncbi:hypothetical protein H2200_005204 [Cladophialophora chaetospira]|uniref:Peptidase S33 tripeptidyl aminopeptidase-like C-terminal domain-containing protein n=1 Tax=Cladophialophora chaetospira TaxID=386627 RepID=A0AA39CJD6_9EURO|nr:hypothetical protein H2200_005204 [Cladophialophora chaetospira]